jgi:hypothetical protein
MIIISRSNQESRNIMKHTIFIFFAFFLVCSMHRAFSMEPLSTHNDVAIINTIDAEINRQQPNSLVDDLSHYAVVGLGNLVMTAGYDRSSVSGQIEGNVRKTMGIVHAFKSVQWNENTIQALYNKNIHFKRAIDYYSARVLTYYANITAENLNKAVNYELEHPVAEVNTLIPAIKKYIIDNVLKKITHEYTMEFSEDHEIERFDICEYDTIHLAATNSHCCDYVSIWSLLTGKLVRQIAKEGNGIDHLSFSPNGSQIAAAVQNRDGTHCLKIWNPQSGSLLYNIPQNESIIFLSYLYESCNNTLLSFKWHDMQWSKQEVWLLDKNAPEYRGSSLISRLQYQYQNRILPSYEASHPKSQLTTTKKLYVTKKVCPALYLCRRAINKTETHESLQKIEGTLPFVALTDYEKTMVRSAVRNRIEALSEKQLRLHAINKILDEDL